MEEQDKIEELERWEQEEDRVLRETLREEDAVWERSKSNRKTDEGSLVMGSSTKRGSKGNLNKGSRKKLRYEIIEEDWGAKKTPKGAGGEPTPCSIDRQVRETEATEEPPPPPPPYTSPSHTQSNPSSTTQYSPCTPSMVPDVVCNINKRKRVCLSHDCPVRSFDVTSKKWEWIMKSKKYGWVSRKNKKYVCESVRPVQCRVPAIILMIVESSEIGLNQCVTIFLR